MKLTIEAPAVETAVAELRQLRQDARGHTAHIHVAVSDLGAAIVTAGLLIGVGLYCVAWTIASMKGGPRRER